MSLAQFGLGVLVGVFLGVGISIFYLRWKVNRQLVGMQDQMQDMMDLTAEMSEESLMEDIEEVEEGSKKEENKD